MKICLSCHKCWTDKGSVQPGSDHFWANIKTAEVTFCGVCVCRFTAEFEQQFKVVPFRLRLEAKKK